MTFSWIAPRIQTWVTVLDRQFRYRDKGTFPNGNAMGLRQRKTTIALAELMVREESRIHGRNVFEKNAWGAYHSCQSTPHKEAVPVHKARWFHSDSQALTKIWRGDAMKRYNQGSVRRLLLSCFAVGAIMLLSSVLLPSGFHPRGSDGRFVCCRCWKFCADDSLNCHERF